MNTEARVGILVLVGVAALAFFVIRIENLGRLDLDQTYTVSVRFSNVAGLRVDDPVQLAGVNVGRVESVGLTADGFAEVTLRIRRDVRVHEDALAVVGSTGMLGDRILEIRPGSPTSRVVGDNDRIKGGAPASVDQLVTVVGGIAADLKSTTDALSRVLGTAEGEATLRDILVNVQGLTGELRDMLIQNRPILANSFAGLDGVVANLDTLSTQLVDSLPDMVAEFRQLAADVSTLIDANDGNIGETANGLREVTQTLNRSATDLEEILSKMSRGEGSFAQIVNEPNTVRKLNDALESIDDTLAAGDIFFRRVGQARFSFNLRSEFYERSDSTRNYFGLRVELGEASDRAAIFHLVDDNIGGFTETNTVTETLDDFGLVLDRTIQRQLVREEGFTFSAVLAQRVNNWQFRGGVVESEAGFGIDYFGPDNRLRLSAEAWDLGRDPDPHVKLRAQYLVFGRFFVTGGWDDLLRDNLRQVFLGGGYSFRY